MISSPFFNFFTLIKVLSFRNFFFESNLESGNEKHNDCSDEETKNEPNHPSTRLLLCKMFFGRSDRRRFPILCAAFFARFPANSLRHIQQRCSVWAFDLQLTHSNATGNNTTSQPLLERKKPATWKAVCIFQLDPRSFSLSVRFVTPLLNVTHIRQVIIYP